MKTYRIVAIVMLLVVLTALLAGCGTCAEGGTCGADGARSLFELGKNELRNDIGWLSLIPLTLGVQWGTHRKFAAIALIVVLVLVLAACGGGLASMGDPTPAFPAQ